jgi:hypothetical protein
MYVRIFCYVQVGRRAPTRTPLARTFQKHAACTSHMRTHTHLQPHSHACVKGRMRRWALKEGGLHTHCTRMLTHASHAERTRVRKEYGNIQHVHGRKHTHTHTRAHAHRTRDWIKLPGVWKGSAHTWTRTRNTMQYIS